MFVVVPREKRLAEGPAVLDAAKPIWELGGYFIVRNWLSE